jgi:F plasmid transfer operon, TraF, protein
VLLCAACACVGSPDPAAAQGFETVGTRAQGMGGAFVAVADDGTATYWNPAGMASIPMFDLTLGFGWQEQEPSTGDATAESRRAAAWRTRSSGFAVALPVLGVSYYRLRTGLALPRATGPPDIVRDDANTGFVGGAATTANLGVSVVQSVGDALVVGGTLRLVRAGAGITTGAVEGVNAALDQADDLDLEAETKFDADLGVMAYVGRARLGLTVRNLVAPTWDSTGGVPLESGRLVRVGVGWGPGPVYGRRSWTIAWDADLTTAEGPDGERRAVAVGGERWFVNGRVAIRGGARAQTIGEARPVATGGASVGVWSGLLLEAQVTGGGDTVERGWGLGARVTF